MKEAIKEISCICHSIPMFKILEICREKGMRGVGDLQKYNICATKCKLCIPFVNKEIDKDPW